MKKMLTSIELFLKVRALGSVSFVSKMRKPSVISIGLLVVLALGRYGSPLQENFKILAACHIFFLTFQPLFLKEFSPGKEREI